MYVCYCILDLVFSAHLWLLAFEGQSEKIDAAKDNDSDVSNNFVV